MHTPTPAGPADDTTPPPASALARRSARRPARGGLTAARHPARPLNLFQKLALISGDLGAIEKDSEAPTEMGGFRFMSHAALLGHLRNRLAHHRVVVMESMAIVTDEVVMLGRPGNEKPNRRVVVNLTATFINADRPDERYTVEFPGEALDTRDKGLGKAGTAAEKAMLSKQFKVGDKDEPDGAVADELASGAAGAGAPAASGQQQRQHPTPQPVPARAAAAPTTRMAQPAPAGANGREPDELDPEQPVCPCCGKPDGLRKTAENQGICMEGLKGCGAVFALASVVRRAKFLQVGPNPAARLNPTAEDMAAQSNGAAPTEPAADATPATPAEPAPATTPAAQVATEPNGAAPAATEPTTATAGAAAPNGQAAA